MFDLRIKEIDGECKVLCKKESNSTLRDVSPKVLMTFRLSDLTSEFISNAPLTFTVINSLCTKKRGKSMENLSTESTEIVVSSILANALFKRCKHMSAAAYRNGLAMCCYET